MLKLCLKCGDLKPRSQFRKQAKVKDGLQSQCKLCAKEWDDANYADNARKVCDRKLRWQIVNASAARTNALRYYHSPRARINRMLNKRLSEILGDNRETVLHLVGIDAKLLADHIESIAPPEFSWDAYQTNWIVGLMKPYTETCDPRRAFHWSNMVPKAKLSPDDLDLV